MMLTRLLVLMILMLTSRGIVCSTEPTPAQQLVIACHRVDIKAVVTLLRSGADVNAKFGEGDTRQHFQDSWSGGWPMNAVDWTPLLALANSSKYPQSPKPYQNTLGHLDWAENAQRAIPKAEIAQRDADRVGILRLLLSHRCDIDAQDSRGATALYGALYQRHSGFAKLLLQFNPKVNTKTGIYIDGTPNITPLHRASWSPDLTRKLLELGADDTAKDGAGDTPADWRKRNSTGLGGLGFGQRP